LKSGSKGGIKYLMLSPEEEKLNQAMAEMRLDPEKAKLLDEIAASNRTHFLKQMFWPEYRKGWIHVQVSRNGDAVEIQWRSLKDILYTLVCNVVEVGFFPVEAIRGQKLFPAMSGNGKFNFQIEQGCSYLFRLIFQESDSQNDPVYMEFPISAPLSLERKELLAKAIHLDQHPAEAIEYQVENFLKKQDALDELRKKGIARIKRRKLESQEEEDRIEDFNDHLQYIKEQCGM
jgi:hypothetical protein